MKPTTTPASSTAAYSVDDYQILVRYDVQALEFTAQVVELPGIILGGITPEAAISQTRWLLGKILNDKAARGKGIAPPGSRPPPTDEDEEDEPAPAVSLVVRKAAAALGHRGGRVKSPARAAASARNGKLGGRPKKLRERGAA